MPLYCPNGSGKHIIVQMDCGNLIRVFSRCSYAKILIPGYFKFEPLAHWGRLSARSKKLSSEMGEFGQHPKEANDSPIAVRLKCLRLFVLLILIDSLCGPGEANPDLTRFPSGDLIEWAN
jgi:hypothetical protein